MAGLASVLILNGPNLNLLGTREPHIYGTDTLEDIEAACADRAAELDLATEFLQSNWEGKLIDAIHAARTVHDGIVINPGGLSHTSVALLDALSAVEMPVIEVHLSNIAKRESFRHHSYISAAAVGTIAGFGAYGYLMALDAMARLLDDAD